MSETTPIKEGDRIHLVTTWGDHCEGVVERVRGESLIDLTATLPRGEAIRITSSPRDDRGRMADSWHRAELVHQN